MNDDDGSDEGDLGEPSPSSSGDGDGEDSSVPSPEARRSEKPAAGPGPWEKGGPSPNRFGRPRKVARMPTELQRYQDIIRSLSKTVHIGGEDVPFDVLNLELLKRLAIAGHAANQRYLDKLNREARQYVTNRETKIIARVDQLYGYLNAGDPPGLVKGELNRLADELKQLYLDIDADAAGKRRKEIRAAKRKLQKLHEKWNKNPPPGWIPDNDEEGGATGTDG